ncbi:hypothetical protein [Sphingomonas sp.]|uniref:hypothetical protein n=1 Tax=Sphingomonas sp. TaxID=28214 RepID=UPI0025CB8EEF|nr:hypothetical protein [Sphingomonas sp.]
MLFRRLLALLLLVAMTLAPLGLTAMAEAAAPASHHGQMAKSAHCDQQSQPDRHHKAADKNCCAAMCIAVVVPSGEPGIVQYHPSRARPASDQDHISYLAELPTPPPRLA